jgi:hypothetical protein
MTSILEIKDQLPRSNIVIWGLPEAINPLVQPKAHDIVDSISDFGILPIQVRLLWSK